MDDIYKEVIAFANTDDGIIYIGIDDQGNLTGIDNADEIYTRLTNGIRDAITPQMKTVPDHLDKNGEMTDKELQELLNIKTTRSYQITRKMQEMGLIEIIGRGAEKKYILK